MNNATFIPYQRLELKNMNTEKIISIIRVSATNCDDTSLILTPRINQSGQAYYWTGLLNLSVQAHIHSPLSITRPSYAGRIPSGSSRHRSS